LKERRGSELARECREEMKSRGSEGIASGWEEERRSFFEEREVRIEEVEERGWRAV